jgi:hypothetical protein
MGPAISTQPNTPGEPGTLRRVGVWHLSCKLKIPEASMIVTPNLCVWVLPVYQYDQGSVGGETDQSSSIVKSTGYEPITLPLRLRYLQLGPPPGWSNGSMAPVLPILSYAPVDYSSCKDTRRSTTGQVFIMSWAAVSWNSQLQPTVATSTTEYMAASMAVKEAL